MDDAGVMFKVTAQSCKEWADSVNKTTYDDLLTNIAAAARTGKYMLNVKTLSAESEVKLLAAGFMVSKNRSRSGKCNSYLVLW